MIWDRLFKRDDGYAPRMPQVDTSAHPQSVFVDARNIGLGYRRQGGPASSERYIALVTPGRHVLQLNCPAPGSRPIAVVEEIRTRFPVPPPGIVMAICLNELTAVRDMRDATRAIPFLPYLLDLGYAGHAVTIFEGHPSALKEGLRGADLVVIDGGMIPFLQPDWQDVVKQVMRHPWLELRHRDGRIENVDFS